MKKTIAFFICGLVALNVHAQSKWYLQASGSIGSSGINQGSSKWKEQYISNIPGYNAQVKVGYHLHNFRLETGVQYSVTGYKQGLIFGNQFPITTPTGSMKNAFREISIPVSVGYQIPLSSKFTLVPYLGFSAGYCLGLHYVTKVPDEDDHSGTISSGDLKSAFHLVNFWGNTAVHIEYKINNRFEVFAGPSFQYMFTNILKYYSPIPEANSVQHNYMYGADLGVKFNL